jgi:hypothetical protein
MFDEVLLDYKKRDQPNCYITLNGNWDILFSLSILLRLHTYFLQICAIKIMTSSFSNQQPVKSSWDSCRTCNICRVVTQITPQAFKILTEDNTSLTSLVLRNGQNWLTDALLIPVLSNNNNDIII